jgi:hypothetical protein
MTRTISSTCLASEQYLNEDLPADKEEWYDNLITAIEVYEEDLWPVSR